MKEQSEKQFEMFNDECESLYESFVNGNTSFVRERLAELNVACRQLIDGLRGMEVEDREIVDIVKWCM